MGKIAEHVYVRCPYGRAPWLLNAYIAELATRGGAERGTLRLTLSTGDFELPGGVKISRDVIAHFAPISELRFGTHVAAVDWTPASGGPFPRFFGSIGVESDGTYDTCSLVLTGEYDPPLGIEGDAFDAAVGERIAACTAREVLRKLKRVLDVAYAREEHAARESAKRAGQR